MKMDLKKTNRTTNIFYYLLFFCVTWLYLIGYAYTQKEVCLIGDESNFFSIADILFNELLKGNLFGEIWTRSYDAYGSYNPKVGMFLTIIVMKVADFLNSLLFLNKEPIILYRMINSIFSALTIVSLFWFIKNITGNLYGLFAAVLLLCNPIFMSISVSLLPEVPMLFFSTISLCLISNIDKKDFFITWKEIILTGFFMGLAVSSKIYAFCIYLVLFCIFIQKLSNIKKIIIFKNFLFTSIVFIFTFYITNPSLYLSPIKNILLMGPIHLKYLIASSPPIPENAMLNVFTYPFLLFRDNPFNVHPICQQDPILWYMQGEMFLVYFCVLFGCFFCLRIKKYLPCFFVGCSFLWSMIPFCFLDGTMVIPKGMLFPAISIITMVSVFFSLIDKNKK
nr:hypothetical protein 7 [bacterium]